MIIMTSVVTTFKSDSSIYQKIFIVNKFKTYYFTIKSITLHTVSIHFQHEPFW